MASRYWPAGRTLCIFYGKTPISESEEEIKPASAINIVGRIVDPDRLKRLAPTGGERMKIAKWQGASKRNASDTYV
ncbi:MAG: hypothetical protein JW878_08875 [Methanomicrobia archaeon]|nr:hypothetical protein [Methanomicrobia archaeon]